MTTESAIRQTLDADGILTLTLDMPGRNANVLNDQLTAPFVDVLDRISSDDVKGIIITSAKKDFLAGADLDRLYAIDNPADAMAMADGFKQFLRNLETCGKPVVAALNGSALGGGMELALGCHHRIALDNAKARFGFPEVTLGLLPGGGGTQRLPRMIGIQNALPYLMEGRKLNPAKAKAAGLLDAIAANEDEMMQLARDWIAANPSPKQPWDSKGFRIPGGDSRHPSVVQIMAIAPSMLFKKTRGVYPAPMNILSAVFEGCLVDIDTALRIESRYFANCVVSSESKNMITALWYQLNRIDKGESRPEDIARTQTRKVGILGAGMMGAGIAYVSARAGIDVVLKDVSVEAAERGKAYSEKLLNKQLQRKRISEEEKQAILDRITATDSLDGFADCDLVIEAVFEDRDLKASVTRDTEAVLPSTATFASNTSTLPITGLAEASVRPDQFIGLHFFSPVDKMPLVEIIKGEKTSAETLARGFDYVQQISKTPIVVNDSRGFYTSRVFGTYVMEGLALLAEGQHPRAIENAGLNAGMPVAPLALHDEVSLELSLHIIDQAHKDFAREGRADEMPAHPAEAPLRKLVEELGRKGRKNGKGLYDYAENGDKKLWPGLSEHFPLSDDALSVEEMSERMMIIQANEAARCFEEGVVTSVADANIGSIFGWGFCPAKGGALQYINDTGVAAFVARCRELAESAGERFAPARILVEMAERGEQFETAEAGTRPRKAA